MRINLFNSEIAIKQFGCRWPNTPPSLIPPSVNLFVKVTNGCNARCAFCSNGGCASAYVDFDHNKLWCIVDELKSKRIIVNRINITGGEPAIAPLIVYNILERASTDKYRDIHLHLNTNGLLPASQELMRHSLWDSISVSLHHYDKDKLSEI